MSKFCGHCGAEVENNYSFCGSCGAMIKPANLPKNNKISSWWSNCSKHKKNAMKIGVVLIVVVILAIPGGPFFWTSSQTDYVDIKTLASSLNSSSPSQNQTYVGKEVETRGYLTLVISAKDFVNDANSYVLTSNPIDPSTATGFMNMVSSTNNSNDPIAVTFNTDKDTRSLKNSAVTVRCTVSSIEGQAAILDKGTCTVEPSR